MPGEVTGSTGGDRGAPTDLRLRLLGAGDSLDALTALLHRAYRRLGDMGLNYTAVDQTTEVTRSRIAGNECWVAEWEGTVVATVVLQLVQRHRPLAARRPEMAYVSQFAVEPDLQSRGIGSALLDHVEARATELGYTTVGLDTALPATHLIDYYAARGYERAGDEHFEGKRYRSVVLVKALAPRA